jgi:hypothetical protein
VTGPRQDDPAVLEGLTQRLEGVAPEFAEVVEEEDASMGQRAAMSPSAGAIRNFGKIRACV